MYTYYTWELLIFLVIKVCGFNSAFIYSMVIPSWSDICDIEIWAASILSLKKTHGAANQLELLAVFSSSDTVNRINVGV